MKPDILSDDELEELNNIDESVVTVQEARKIIAGLILQYPDTPISEIRPVSHACVIYLYNARISGDEQRLRNSLGMLIQGKMPKFKVFKDGTVDLSFDNIPESTKEKN